MWPKWPWQVAKFPWHVWHSAVFAETPMWVSRAPCSTGLRPCSRSYKFLVKTSVSDCATISASDKAPNCSPVMHFGEMSVTVCFIVYCQSRLQNKPECLKASNETFTSGKAPPLQTLWCAVLSALSCTDFLIRKRISLATGKIKKFHCEMWGRINLPMRQIVT